MTKTIELSVGFSASARELYDIYMDPTRHAAATGGGAVTISPKAGSKFSAFRGLLRGTTLCTVPGKLIVQRWRSRHWKPGDVDSVLVLSFVQVGKRGRIDLVHVNVPQHDHAGVTRGWKKYYWIPLAAYLKGRVIGRRAGPKMARLKLQIPHADVQIGKMDKRVNWRQPSWRLPILTRFSTSSIPIWVTLGEDSL